MMGRVARAFLRSFFLTAFVLFQAAVIRVEPATAEEGKPGVHPAAVTATAVVEDQYGEVMKVEAPIFFRPASGFSLMGGSKAEKLKEIRVWKGAHEISVSLEKVLRIDVIGPVDQDLLQVKLSLAGGQKLEGKIERDLELHGRVEFGQYQIKFERLKTVTIRT